MPTQLPVVWPPSDALVHQLLASHESQFLEFKQQWYALDTKAAKAEMVRDLLALANTADSSQPSYLLVGVRDRKHGGGIVGVPVAIDLDQLVQIFTSFATPVPDFRLASHEVHGLPIAIVGIFATPHRPYYATRDHEGILSTRAFYVRRGPVVGTMTAPEIRQVLATASAGQIGAPISPESLLIGFVERGSWNGPHGPTVRLANLSNEAIRDIDLVFDVRLSRDPTSFTRIPHFTNLVLQGGESREAELNLHSGSFYVGDKRIGGWEASQPNKWFDIVARARYRDDLGLLRELTAKTYLAD